MINYIKGDEIVSKDNPNKIIGVCTGFTENNTCILINKKCWGGKIYFMKSEFVEFDYVE
jgi:hypothetical protein